MTPTFVRRAGQGRVADAVVTWTVAEGRRGRRWREVVVAPDGGIRHSLLLETSPEARFMHLELATPAGLLTLHPEGDGTLHGNAITADGIGHVVGLPWQPDGVVLVAGSPLAFAAAAASTSRGSAERARSTAGYVVRPDLSLGPIGVASTDVPAVDLDADGLPALAAGRSWPLEG